MKAKKQLKKINSKEQKKLLLEMLKYIDTICRENSIKYSLIGGSLIGAIRHKGFIPWDDDIDIILDTNNYNKLIDILRKQQNKNYEVFIPNETKTYSLPFAKLINKKTIILKELDQKCEINNYGLFIDIFRYSYLPEDEKERRKLYKKIHFYKSSLVKAKLNFKKLSLYRNMKRLSKNIYVSIFGYKNHLNKVLKLYDQYLEKPTKYVMHNNPVYGYEKDIQKAENIKDYIDAEFENTKVMIFKNYDEILRITYGDYMKMPPENERINHELEVYWKDSENT